MCKQKKCPKCEGIMIPKTIYIKKSGIIIDFEDWDYCNKCDYKEKVN